MATVKMKCGNILADIYDSEETIAQAISDGYVLVKEEPKPQVKKEEVVEKSEEVKPVHRTSSTSVERRKTTQSK